MVKYNNIRYKKRLGKNIIIGITFMLFGLLIFLIPEIAKLSVRDGRDLMMEAIYKDYSLIFRIFGVLLFTTSLLIIISGLLYGVYITNKYVIVICGLQIKFHKKNNIEYFYIKFKKVNDNEYYYSHQIGKTNGKIYITNKEHFKKSGKGRKYNTYSINLEEVLFIIKIASFHKFMIIDKTSIEEINKIL